MIAVMKTGIIKQRPKSTWCSFPGEGEEEVSNWASKKGKHSVVLVCSCSSRLGDDLTNHGEGRGHEEAASEYIRQHRVLLVRDQQPR